MKTHFVSDLHFFHKNIVSFTDRGKFTTQENHTEWLIELWNQQVQKGDTVWHLGDFSFGNTEQTVQITKQLNGQIFMLKGNHDKAQTFENLKSCGLIQDWYDYKEIKIQGTPTVLFHFPVAAWHRQGYGSYHLHGHCFDADTEVLTENGFKSWDKIQTGEKIATVNLENMGTEYQNFSHFHKYHRENIMYEYNGRSVDFRITNGHRFVYTPYGSSVPEVKEVEKVKGQIKIPVCSENTRQDFPIEDDILRLYVHICTDGSFENKDLVRFHYRKQRKIDKLTELLTKLGIKFSKNKQKSGTVKMNFNLPPALCGLKIKPLDRELVRNLSKRQVDILVETYIITDGSTTGKNSFQISTSKESEAELLQETLVTSGYCCNKLKRVRGQYIGFVLSVNTRKQCLVTTKNFSVSSSPDFVWCLTVPNSTLIVRRGGKVHVTGNCHGNLKQEFQQGKILDVGLDNAIKLYGQPKFFDEDMIVECMASKERFVSDHHAER